MDLDFTYKSALVTGGAGFIGSHLVDALLAAGTSVTVLDNLSTGHLSNLSRVYKDIRFLEGDIREPGMLEKAAKGAEAVFHLAAVVSVTQTVQDPVTSTMVNDVGTLNVFTAARKAGCQRVVFSSSCAVYGDDPSLPKSETSTIVPKSPYALQKRTGERWGALFHQLYGLEGVSLRYFNVFGPRQDPSSPYSGVISIFLSRAVRKKAPVIYGDGLQTRDFVAVQDVVAANLKAAVCPSAPGNVYNIGTGKERRILSLWNTIQEAAGTTIEPEFAPPRPGDILRSRADISLARRDLGFSPSVSFRDGLMQTYQWYKSA